MFTYYINIQGISELQIQGLINVKSTTMSGLRIIIEWIIIAKQFCLGFCKNVTDIYLIYESAYYNAKLTTQLYKTQEVSIPY